MGQCENSQKLRVKSSVLGTCSVLFSLTFARTTAQQQYSANSYSLSHSDGPLVSLTQTYPTLPSPSIPMESPAAGAAIAAVKGIIEGSQGPESPYSIGTPTMFHYQMYSNPPTHHHSSSYYDHPTSPNKRKKRCYQTENGIRCKHRREGDGSSSSGGYSEPVLKYSYGPPKQGEGSGWGMQNEGEKSGGGSLAGLTGLIGLLGLKGLAVGLKGWKGAAATGLIGLPLLAVPFIGLLALPLLPLLGLLALPLLPLLGLIALPVILPLLLPIILFKTLIKIALILLKPVAVFPGFPGRDGSQIENEDSSEGTWLPEMPIIMMKVLNSEQCLEKITCNLSAKVRFPGGGESLLKKLTQFLPKDEIFSRVRAGLKYYKKYVSPSSQNSTFFHEGESNVHLNDAIEESSSSLSKNHKNNYCSHFTCNSFPDAI